MAESDRLPDYRPGQVVDGHLLTEDGRWVLLAASPRPGRGYWSRFRGRIGWVILVVLGLLSVVILPIPGLERINLGLWAPQMSGALWLFLFLWVAQALVIVALPIGLVVAAFPSRTVAS